MVTISSAENALKNVYLDVVANQLNISANPLLAQIKRSSSNIYGKEIKKIAPLGVNGGFGAGDEVSELPTSNSNINKIFTSELKNLYGTIEISDKALKATSGNVNSFVNLLTEEMDGLVKACNFNLGRMLYGDGSGLVATASATATDDWGTVSDISKIVEGMVLDVYDASGNLKTGAQKVVVDMVDRKNKKFHCATPGLLTSIAFASGFKLYVQNSKDKELTGIEGIFSNSTLYGLTKAEELWLNPYVTTDATVYMSDLAIQKVIDELEMYNDSKINYIACPASVRRLYQEYLGAYRRNIDITTLNGGYSTICHNGVPIVAEKFCPENTMYLLNTNDFTLYEMGDWKWLEDDNGRILRQKPGYPVYTANLVKYAELICDKPAGQAKIVNIATTLATN